MNKTNLVLWLPLFSSVLLASCGEQSPKTISMVDMSRAKSLFIGAIADEGASQTKENHLLKMTEDGFIEEVTFTYVDDKGKEYTETNTNNPLWVKEVNDDYIYLAFTNYPGGNLYNYLVNKTTNRAYKLPESYAFDSYFCNATVNIQMIPREEAFPSISKDSFYVLVEYENFVSKIVKVDLSNPDDIVSTSMMAANDRARQDSFAVDSNGNLAYSGFDANDADVVRLVTPTGLTKNIPVDSSFCDFWKGYDGYIYVNNDGKEISRVTLEDNEIKLTKYGTKMVPTRADWAFRGTYASRHLYLDKQQKILNVVFKDGISEIYNKEGEPKFTAFADMSTQLRTIKCVASSDDYVYVSGQLLNGDPVIARIDVSGEQYEVTPLTSSLYDASSISVDNDENLSFCGLSMMNGSVVVGTISSNGEVKVSETQLDREVDSFVEVSIN